MIYCFRRLLSVSTCAATPRWWRWPTPRRPCSKSWRRSCAATWQGGYGGRRTRLTLMLLLCASVSAFTLEVLVQVMFQSRYGCLLATTLWPGCADRAVAAVRRRRRGGGGRRAGAGGGAGGAGGRGHHRRAYDGGPAAPLPGQRRRAHGRAVQVDPIKPTLKALELSA